MHRETVITELRAKARKGDRPSQILRELVLASPSQPHKLDLIRDVREAFCLTLQQAKPIAGWDVDGRGELSDQQLDDFLMPEILKNQVQWEIN